MGGGESFEPVTESVLRKPLITSCSSRLWQCIVFLHSFLFVGLGSALSAFCTHVALCSYIF